MRSGFTLLETLVSLAIFGIIFAIVLAVLTSFTATNVADQRQELFEQAKNNIAVELSNTIRWAETITVGNDWLSIDGQTYRLVDGRLTKTGQPITGANIVVTNFAVKDLSTTSDLGGIQITMAMHNRNQPTLTDTLKLVVSQRKLSVETEIE